MSLQAQHCVQVLALLYAEMDQRSGWASSQKVEEFFAKEGIATGRTNHAITTLRNLKMIDSNSADSPSIRLSSYGVNWFEHNFPLISRGKTYQYSIPLFRRVKLVGPDEFYGKTKISDINKLRGTDWTMWGAILATVIGMVTIAIMKGWL